MRISTNSLNREALRREESIYHTANGYLGVRGNFEEGYPEGDDTIRGCYINAFYDTIELRYPEKLYGFPETAQRLANLPDLQTTRLYLDGEEFSLFTGSISEYLRELDMESGVVTRSVRWQSPKGTDARLTFKRIVSFARPELFLTEITVEAAAPCELKIVSGADCGIYNYFNSFDPRVASERQQYIYMEDVEIAGEAAVAVSRTSTSGLKIAAAMSHRINSHAETRTVTTPNGFETMMTLRLGASPVVIEKFCAYSDSRRYPDCKKRSLEVINAAAADGSTALFAEQRAYLDRFWAESGITIHGDKTVSEGMAFNLYGLLQSAGRDAVSNIAAKGLSGEGYEGHYFWDTEIYMFPFFLLTRPEHAKTLLAYRHSILDSAREQARLLGHKKGALYSWRTITGSECSPYYPSGSAQYHINGDVAHSFMQYYYATGDIDFMEEKGAEVLVETARLWLDAGTYDRKGRLCYNDVTGPDEYTCMVNNNYFTNLSAKHNLLGAVYICNELMRQNKFEGFADRLRVSDSELAAFSKAAGDIYIPYDSELDINPQDDSFLDKEKWDLKSVPKENFPLLTHYHPICMYRGQVCKQADTVLAHYLYDDATASTVRNSYDYYEPITTHDSTLSKCVFSIMASQLGMREQAYDYFLDTVRTDLDDTHGNTKDGIHTANMGGAYLAVTAGFAGLRIKPDGFHFNPILPEAWTGYEFGLNWKGSLIHVCVKADGVTFTLKSGAPVTVFVNGKAYVVKDGANRAVHTPQAQTPAV